MPNTIVAGGTIPPIDAVQLTTNWRNADSTDKLAAIGQIKGIFIPSDDIDNLRDIIVNSRGAGCRAYFGIDYSFGPPVFRFMIVPTSDQQKDIWEVNDASTIYDFTRPCPTQCDTSSPLYNNANWPPNAAVQVSHEAAAAH